MLTPPGSPDGNIAGGTFDINANINPNALTASGTLSIGGTIASQGFNSGTLLTGTMSSTAGDPNFGAGVGDPLEFLFTVTGGDAAGLYGGAGGTAGVTLSQSGYAGSFANNFASGSFQALSDTFLPITVTGAEFAWDGNGADPPSGQFEDAFNWSVDAGVPGVEDTALFALPQQYQIELTADQSINAAIFKSKADVTIIGELPSRSWGVVDRFSIDGPSVTLGSLTLNINGDLDVFGGGSLNVDDRGTLDVLSSLTIQANSAVEVGQSSFQLPLNITNGGVIRAARGGVITAGGSVLDNQSGMLTIDMGGEFRLAGGASNVGGATSGEGELRIAAGQSATLNGVRLNGVVAHVADGAVVNLLSGVDGTGSWQANGGTIALGTDVQVTTTGTVDVTAGGTIFGLAKADSKYRTALHSQEMGLSKPRTRSSSIRVASSPPAKA